MKPTLLIKTGETIPEIAASNGDFENWFAAGLGLELRQVDVYKHQQPPEPEQVGGVVITGSPAMVSHREGWSEYTANWLKQVVALDVPVLGICYGHQLLAHAMGGEVGPNPNGRQMGTTRINLHKAAEQDRLLQGLASDLQAQTTHVESVLELPLGAERLASTDKDPNHGFRIGNSWGLQFHPEFSTAVMKDYIHLRSEPLRNEGTDPVALSAQVSETPEAWSILKRFASVLS